MDQEHYEYRTGQTRPTKNSSALISFLFICIILLCGLVSALGLMNIRLFKLLEDSRQPSPPVSFMDGEAHPSPEADLTLEGMALQELPAVYQQLHGLPQGLYICLVDPDSAAAKLGIAPGDVLVTYDGTAVSSLAELKALQATHSSATVVITTCRDGQHATYTLTLQE